MFSIVWSDTTSGAMPLIAKCRSRNSIQLVQHEISRISCSTGELRTDSHAWEQRQLGESFNMLRNNTLSRADLSNDRKGILDIHYGDVLIRYRAVVDVSTLQGPSINITDNRFLGDQLTDGDIIMADTAEDTSAGKCVEIEGVMHRNVVAGLHTIPLRPATPSSHRYWGQYLNSASFRNQLFSKMQGTKVISLSRTTVSNATVRYPSLPEQRRIGEFFSAIDNLIAAAERQEALLRQKKQAYLQLMFPKEGETEPLVRFAGFNEQWQQRQLGEVAEIVGGGTPDSSNADYWDGDIDWYIPSEIGESRIVQASARKITREGLNHSSARLLPAGSILFTSRASIGLMAFISHPSATNQGFQSLIPNGEVDPDFLYALGPCISRYAKKHAAGSTFIEISGSSLAKAPLRIPRLPEQRLIGQLFSTFDKIISAAEQQIESLQMSKAAYLQRMFI